MRDFFLSNGGLSLAPARAALCALVIAWVCPAAAADQGRALYEQHCRHCHGGTVAKAPPFSLLQIMSAGSILRAMESGIMQQQAAAMSSLQRRQVAEYITGTRLGEAVPAAAPRCDSGDPWFDFDAAPDQRAWGGDYANRRFTDLATGGVDAGNVSRLELAWVLAFPGAIRARSQPATAGGALFVGSQDGTVYALDQRSGCIHWTFQTVAEVRTGIVVEDWSETGSKAPLLYFGDLVGNAYALNALTGELVWRDRPDDHPSLTLTAAPTLHNGVLYVPMSALEVTEAADPHYACCTFRGGVAAYEARTGKRLWKGYSIPEEPREVGRNAVGTPQYAPSGAPVWNTPAVDEARGLLYMGTGTNYSSPANSTSDAVIALSMRDGRMVWSAQMTEGDAWNMGCESDPEKTNCPPENGPDLDFGAAVIIARTAAGKDILVAGQKSGDVYGLDPDNRGAILWERKLGRGGIQGGVHFGMAVDDQVVYVPMSDFKGGGGTREGTGERRPGMYALELSTGKTLWFAPTEDICRGREFCQPGLSAAATAIPGAVVAGAMDGQLRVYSRDSGEVIWAFDSAVPFTSLSGASAHGGSFGGGAGPVFKDGMLFVNSGYGIYFHMPGNVLLAFRLAATED